MKSKWYELKEKAIALRREGLSIRAVEEKLRIPRSTLSGWFRGVKLSKQQVDRLKLEWTEGLEKARTKAILWHNAEKARRLVQAKSEATRAFEKIDLNAGPALDLALAMLYLGEGMKKNGGTAMGNSDPLILKFFISALKINYNIDSSKIRCELHLRADQDPNKIKNFWSRRLNIPKYNFKSISIDTRTKGSVTYPTYKGVCVVRFGRVDIQRKLLFLSRLVCEHITLKKWTRSSVG